MTYGDWIAMSAVLLTIVLAIAAAARASLARMRMEWNQDMTRCARFCEAVYAPKADLVRLEERIKGIEGQIIQVRADTKDILQLLRRANG